MSDVSLAYAIVCAALAATPAGHVSVAAGFVPPAQAGADAAIAVTLTPRVAGIVVNERPAPRLSLDPDQTVLVDKQPPRVPASAPVDPTKAKYLDPRAPVHFPVALQPSAPRGTHVVSGAVTFYYCSKAEGWCRKATSPIRVEVTVPPAGNPGTAK